MTSWRTWSGRWAVVLAGAALAVVPAVARACDDEEEAPRAQVQGRLEDEGARQAYLKSVEKLGSDEERARALVKLMADAPISEGTGAAILEVAARMKSDQALARVLSFFHQIQEWELVRGPLARRYLDTAARLQSQEALARVLAEELHPRAIPESEVSRALELSQRIASDEGLKKVLREVTDHQGITADIETKYRAVAERLSSAEAKQRALELLERAKGGDDRHARREHRLPRFAFRFGDEGTRVLPAVPAVPALPPAPPMAPMPPAPPEPPLVVIPRDGEVIVNGRHHELSQEQREAIRESARRIREQARQMKEQIKEQMRELRHRLREDLRREEHRQDIEDFEIDLGNDE